MKGWLDKYNDGGPVQPNYNDASVSMSADFVGMGNDTTGRNYSPAWGGQFEDGGEIAQTGKNVPATKQDSLNLYNNTKQVLNYYNSKKYQKEQSDFNKLRNNSRLTPEIYSDDITVANQAALKKFREDNKIKTNLFGNITGGVKVPLSSGKAEIRQIPESTYYRKINNDTYYQGELINNILDTRSPMQLFDKRIAPTMRNSYVNNDAKDSMYQDRISLNLYDPVLVKPESMLTPEERALRIQKYGPSSVSTSKPTKPVVNPESKSIPLSAKKPVVNQERVYQKETPELQPLPIQGMDANLPELQRIEGPSKWMRSFGAGANQNYWSKVDAYGIPLPGYTAPNQNAVVQPQGPVPEFAMGGSMPGAVGFTYARVAGSAPSKGPYGKKTPASAQNGTEMKYYQEGLDFKPKSISKDGTTIYNPKTKIGFDKISAKDYIAVPPKPVATPDYNMFDKFVLGTDAFVKDALDYKTYLKGADIVAGSAIKGLRNLGVPVPDAAKEFFFNKVRPVSYPTDLISAAREVLRSDKAPPAKDSSGNLRVDEEAWSMAMGRPTQSKYIVPSKYKPSNAKDPNAKYHTFAKGVIDPKVLTDLVSDDKFWNKYKQVNKSGKEYLPSVSLEPYLTDSFKKEYIKTANDEFSQTDPLANFQIYRGVDPKTKKKYAAISDVYDFGLETANALTNPINFYDRFYYKDGGPIKDDRGQWAHPGKVTKIGSNQITMQGVPYPVLGISDTGDTQMMYPNQDYTYHGSSVTEYPMMRKGGQTPKINNETLARNQRIARADAASKEPLSAESLAIISEAIPDRRRFSEEIKSISPGISNWIDNNSVASYIDRNLNPSVVAGKIVSNFGHIPLNIKQGDYEQALLNFVSPLALISGAPATKNLLNPNNNKKLSGPSVASTYEQGGQLTKLDQLTNFTNYNTKQPGGWLDKYQ